LKLATFALSLLLLASPAGAAGVNLAWNQALPEGGSATKQFNCASGLGESELVGSFVCGQPHPLFIGCEALLDIQAATTSLPDWWQFGAGSCRSEALACGFDFRGLQQTLCSSPYEGNVFGGVAAYATSARPLADHQPAPNAARIKIAGVHLGTGMVSAGEEYFAFRLTISHEGSAGAGSCGGCAVPVCLTLTEVKVYDDVPVAENGQQSPPPSFERITGPARGNVASWQDAGSGCQSAVKNRTWGQLKSAYR
jgi:hypothetical protein